MTTFTRRMMLDTVLSAAAAGVFVRPVVCWEPGRSHGSPADYCV